MKKIKISELSYSSKEHINRLVKKTITLNPGEEIDTELSQSGIYRITTTVSIESYAVVHAGGGLSPHIISGSARLSSNPEGNTDLLIYRKNTGGNFYIKSNRISPFNVTIEMY